MVVCAGKPIAIAMIDVSQRGAKGAPRSRHAPLRRVLLLLCRAGWLVGPEGGVVLLKQKGEQLQISNAHSRPTRN